jgi:hypothetical protein
MKIFLSFLVFLFALSLWPLLVHADQDIQPQLQLQNGGNTLPQQAPAIQQEDIFDIRGPVPIPEKNNYPLIIGIVFLGMLVAVLLFFLLRKLLKKEVPIPAPGEIALSELQEAQPLRKKGQALQYAERLSDIVRRYIEAQFSIQFTRQTTREFLHQMAADTRETGKLLQPHRDMLQTCMEKCDMAKYARNTLESEGMKEMEDSVHRFITTTSSPENTQGKE